MSFKLYTTRKTNVPDLGQIQEDFRDCLNPALKKEILDGNLTVAIAVTTSFQNVPHKLGKKFTGWISVSPDADARIWQDPVANNNPDAAKFIRVRASAAVNCRFWVF